MMLDFLRDRRGNYALMTALALVPIMGGLAIAVDLSEMSRERSMMLNSLDAAGMATARHLVTGASEDALKAYAKDFFESNLGEIDPSKTNLTVTLPTNQAGGGTLKLCATIDYDPYFVPVFQGLIDAPKTKDIKTADCTEIRLKNTLEVALVLDNSGSMSEYGSGSGQRRITLLKTAAKQLVDTLALQAQMMTQLEKPVQFSLVPFAASVNIAPANDNQPWMDTQGISPIHHENFDWSQMTAANDPNKYAEQVGGVWYKRGVGWGETENLPLTRFSLYQDIVAETDREAIPNTSRRVCTRYRDGRCERYTNEPEYQYSVSQYTSWQGCVEARPAPYNTSDATPIASTPATLFVPMFGSDEAGHLWRDLNDDGEPDLNGNGYGYANNWWADWADTGASSRQADMRKYFRVKPYEASSAGSGKGPNYSCTTNPITPLTDVTTEEGLITIKDAIDAMAANGNTNVPEGLAWGWRTVSHGEPFTQGRPDNEKGNDKVVIVLTDGINTYSTAGSDAAGNKSTYAAYGYAGVGYNGTGTTRLFMETSVGTFNYSSSNYTAALNEHLAKVCDNAKEGRVLVMTVSLDLSTSDSQENAAINALRTCSSESRFRKDADGKPSKLFWNATGSNLAEKFKEIADELSNLRIVS